MSSLTERKREEKVYRYNESGKCYTQYSIEDKVQKGEEWPTFLGYL